MKIGCFCFLAYGVFFSYILTGCSQIINKDICLSQKVSRVKCFGSYGDGYINLLQKCQNDERNGENTVNISDILKAVDSRLMHEFNSPLSYEIVNASIPEVLYYGEILLEKSVAPDGRMSHSEKIQLDRVFSWMIAGLRRESFIQCRMAAIRYEKELIDKKIVLSGRFRDGQLLLESVVAHDWFYSTICFVQERLSKWKRWEITDEDKSVIIDLEKCMSALKSNGQEYEKDLDLVLHVVAQVKTRAETPVRNQALSLLDNLVVPDLQLHIIKQQNAE